MILKENGFTITENPNEYVKDDWTIRLENNKIEAFNSFDSINPKYIFTEDKMLNQIIREINSF